MRPSLERNMIGVVLFYVFYPFSQFLRRFSEASKKAVCPSVVNGRTVWDGGTSTVRNSQSETALLNQRGETMGDAKEGKEPGLMEGSNTNLDTEKKHLTAVLQKDTQNDSAPKTNEMQPAMNEEVEDLKQEDCEVVIGLKVLQNRQDMEDKSTSLDGDISSQQVLAAQFECLQTGGSTPEVTCPAESQIQSETSGVSVITTEESRHSCSGFEQPQMSNADESQTSAKTAFEGTESWDECLVPTGDVTADAAEKSKFMLASLLSSTQTHPNLGEKSNAQAGWHFPAGPGLAEEVHCPMWPFPSVSYYPPMESVVPFEVMWRVWEDLDEEPAAAESALIPFPFKKTSVDFTVMSYNILAQDLLEANKHLYVHCLLEVLDWNYRCSLLLKEIESWSPDILCLQEVQENYYHEQLYPVLSQMGYTCVYKRRTGTKTDGCAICYRSTCFAQVAFTKLEFFRPETELLDRHNVGIVLLLRPLVVQEAGVKEMGPPLCVANTHLLFNPRRGDVKLAQLAIMMAEIDAMVKSCKARGEHCNVVLCGDFNSLPHMPLYQLITTGELYYQGLPAWMISGQEDLSYKPTYHKLWAPLWPSSVGVTDNCQYRSPNNMSESQSQKSGKRQYTHEFMLQLRYCPAACVRPQGLVQISGVTDVKPDASRDNKQTDEWFRQKLRHRLDLESVYKHVLPGSGSPEITTLHSEGGATVDYIFYSPKHTAASDRKARGKFADKGLKLTGFLSLLSEDVLWSLNGLPNHIFPSDHLSLVARFQLDLDSA